MLFSGEDVLRLAKVLNNNFLYSCKEPVIRGINGEESLKGKSYKEIAEKNGITIEKAKRLTVDLSDTPFDELPEYWQIVNIETAKELINLVPSFAQDGIDGATVLRIVLAPDYKVQNKFAAKLHKAWLQDPKNNWALGTELDRPFEALPDEERQNRIQQLMSLYNWLATLTE